MRTTSDSKQPFRGRGVRDRVSVCHTASACHGAAWPEGDVEACNVYIYFFLIYLFIYLFIYYFLYLVLLIFIFICTLMFLFIFVFIFLFIS